MVQSHVAQSRIRLEGRLNTGQNGKCQQWIKPVDRQCQIAPLSGVLPCVLQFQADWHSIAHQVRLENEEEEIPEMLKHLDEDVPVESDIWCEVLDGDHSGVCPEESPGAGQEVRNCQENGLMRC